MSRPRFAVLSGALIVVTTLVAGALPAGVAAAAEPSPGSAGVVAGEVSAGGNVAAATVTLRDRGGAMLDGTARTSTLPGGAFALRVERLPRAFRVEVKG